MNTYERAARAEYFSRMENRFKKPIYNHAEATAVRSACYETITDVDVKIKGLDLNDEIVEQAINELELKALALIAIDFKTETAYSFENVIDAALIELERIYRSELATQCITLIKENYNNIEITINTLRKEIEDNE